VREWEGQKGSSGGWIGRCFQGRGLLSRGLEAFNIYKTSRRVRQTFEGFRLARSIATAPPIDWPYMIYVSLWASFSQNDRVTLTIGVLESWGCEVM
jgi:hypothetical protein